MLRHAEPVYNRLKSWEAWSQKNTLKEVMVLNSLQQALEVTTIMNILLR